MVVFGTLDDDFDTESVSESATEEDPKFGKIPSRDEMKSNQSSKIKLGRGKQSITFEFVDDSGKGFEATIDISDICVKLKDFIQQPIGNNLDKTSAKTKSSEHVKKTKISSNSCSPKYPIDGSKNEKNNVPRSESLENESKIEKLLREKFSNTDRVINEFFTLEKKNGKPFEEFYSHFKPTVEGSTGIEKLKREFVPVLKIEPRQNSPTDSKPIWEELSKKLLKDFESITKPKDATPAPRSTPETASGSCQKNIDSIVKLEKENNEVQNVVNSVPKPVNDEPPSRSSPTTSDTCQKYVNPIPKPADEKTATFPKVITVNEWLNFPAKLMNENNEGKNLVNSSSKSVNDEPPSRSSPTTSNTCQKYVNPISKPADEKTATLPKPMTVDELLDFSAKLIEGNNEGKDLANSSSKPVTDEPAPSRSLSTNFEKDFNFVAKSTDEKPVTFFNRFTVNKELKNFDSIVKPEKENNQVQNLVTSVPTPVNHEPPSRSSPTTADTYQKDFNLIPKPADEKAATFLKPITPNEGLTNPKYFVNSKSFRKFFMKGNNEAENLVTSVPKPVNHESPSRSSPTTADTYQKDFNFIPKSADEKTAAFPNSIIVNDGLKTVDSIVKLEKENNEVQKIVNSVPKPVIIESSSQSSSISSETFQRDLNFLTKSADEKPSTLQKPISTEKPLEPISKPVDKIPNTKLTPMTSVKSQSNVDVSKPIHMERISESVQTSSDTCNEGLCSGSIFVIKKPAPKPATEFSQQGVPGKRLEQSHLKADLKKEESVSAEMSEEQKSVLKDLNSVQKSNNVNPSEWNDPTARELFNERNKQRPVASVAGCQRRENGTIATSVGSNVQTAERFQTLSTTQSYHNNTSNQVSSMTDFINRPPNTLDYAGISTPINRNQSQQLYEPFANRFSTSPELSPICINQYVNITSAMQLLSSPFTSRSNSRRIDPYEDSWELSSFRSSGSSLNRTNKFNAFVSNPGYNQPVTALPGIGKVGGQRLRNAGFDSVGKVYKQYERLGRDQRAFKCWLGNVSGLNSRWVSDCFDALECMN